MAKQKNGIAKKLMKREVDEHAELWRDSPKFRASVERKLKGPKATRQAMGKR